MKNLLLILVTVIAFNSNAQPEFVSRVYDAQQLEKQSMTLISGLKKALKPTLWRGGPDDVMIMEEGGLDIPMMEFGFAQVTDTSASYYDYTRAETSFYVHMIMFDKSESDRVKAFCKEFLDDVFEPIIYFETATTMSCMIHRFRNGAE